MALPQNNMPLNRAALKWLKEAKVPAPNDQLHLLNLAQYGMELERAAKAEWPDADQNWLKEQLAALSGWKAGNVLVWLFSNPKRKGNPPQQQAKLHREVQRAPDPKEAATHVLNAIYSKQTSVPESEAKPSAASSRFSNLSPPAAASATTTH